MDVSRVSMVTPKVIDWRKLTAKDIIKYDAEGMEIPSQYLSWARSFQVDLEKNDTDETTYEMAVSKPANIKQQMQQAASAPTDTDNISGSTGQPENTPVQDVKNQQKTTNGKAAEAENSENKPENVKNNTNNPQIAGVPNNTMNTQNSTAAVQNNTAGNQNRIEDIKNNTTAVQQQSNTNIVKTANTTNNTQQTDIGNEEEIQNGERADSDVKTETNKNSTEEVKTNNTVQDETEAEETDTGENQTTENNSAQKSVEEMNAQEKLQYLKEQGYSNDKILRTFRADSISKGSAAEEGSGVVSGVQDSSNSTAETVESFMQQVMSDAQDLQQKLNSGKKKDRLSNIARLNEQLNQLGTSAQTTLATYETAYLGYGMSISEQEPVGSTAIDFGEATVELSEPYLRNPLTYATGRWAKKAGESASKNGTKLQEDATSAAQANDSNSDAISGHQNTVMDLTGVKAVDVQPLEGEAKTPDTTKTGTNTSDTNGDNTSAQTTKTTDKTKADKEEKAPVIAKAEEKLKKGDNTETDEKKTDVEKKEEKIASGSLDEILKRRLRKGEEISA